jgi:hypothetical protein
MRQTDGSRRLSLLGTSWLLGCLLLGGLCLFRGLDALGEPEARTRWLAVEQTERRTKPIEDVQIDDLVLARDEYGSGIAPQPVVRLFRSDSDHLRILTFQAADGSEQTLQTTDEHPFWVVGRDDYIEARHLQTGMVVVGPAGQAQTLTATDREEHPQGVPVYNFEVADAHTYFVSQDGLAAAVLVHNTQCGIVRKFDGPIHHIASNKDAVFRPKFEQLFNRAGVNLDNSPWNRMRLQGHVGPHGKYYNELIFDRLNAAVGTKTGKAAKTALIEELKAIRRDIRYNGWDALLKARASWIDVMGLY